MKIESSTRISTPGPIHVEDRGDDRLFVSQETGGWWVCDDQLVKSLMETMMARGTDEVSLQKVAEQIGSTSEQVWEVARPLFDKGVLAVEKRVRSTSSARPLGMLPISPKTGTHNAYPALGVFHVHNWCNLACSYCYTMEAGIVRQTMTLERMIRGIDQLFELPTRRVNVEFHGGEPTMAMKLIKDATAHAQRRSEQTGKPVDFSIQTNGYLLTEDTCEFFLRNSFAVRVSLDGTQETHDEFRRNHAGRGSYLGVVKGIRRLQEAGLEVHAVCVVHNGNKQLIKEMYDSMAGLKVTSIRFLPVFESGSAGNEDWLDGDTWFQVYTGLLQHVLERAKTGEQLPPLANLTAGEIGSLRSFKREYMCMRNPCGAGTNMVAIDTNGDLYPCEEMVGKPEFVLGNIDTDDLKQCLDTSPLMGQLRARHVDEIEDCRVCPWKQMCHGGCVHKSYTHFKVLNRESEHCAYYKRIYRELIWMEREAPGTWQILSPSPAVA